MLLIEIGLNQWFPKRVVPPLGAVGLHRGPSNELFPYLQLQ
jgi:hypothetical protein